MKGLFILTSFLGLCFFAITVHSQEDSCSSPLKLQSPLPFDTSSLHCATVWGSRSFILRYQQTAPNVWSFVLSAPNTNAYVGIGFSPTGMMVGSSAIVGWVGTDGASVMKRYYLGGKAPGLVKPDEGNLDVSNSSMVVQSNRIFMAFQLNTNMPEKRVIYSIGQEGRLPSSNFVLSEHQDMVSTSLDYTTGQFETKKSSPYVKLRKTHGILNMLGWAILMPIGAMVARYMRQWDPIWFYAHTAIQSIAFILGVSGVICGLVLEDRIKASVNKHKAIGIFVLVFGCLQVIAFLARPDKLSKVRKYWNWYHFSVGRALIFLAAVNVFYGIHLGDAGAGWNAGFAIVIVIFFIVSLFLELRMCMKK